MTTSYSTVEDEETNAHHLSLTPQPESTFKVSSLLSGAKNQSRPDWSLSGSGVEWATPELPAKSRQVASTRKRPPCRQSSVSLGTQPSAFQTRSDARRRRIGFSTGSPLPSVAHRRTS